MFINKAKDGCNNVCGKNIAKFRKQIGLSQRELADLLQINGLDLDKNAIQRIECGKRFVTDIELSLISKAIVDDSENSPLFEHPASCAI